MIPHFKQESIHTCGPACMRMVLAASGINKSEKQLARLMRSSTKHGTHHWEFPKLAEKLKLQYVVGQENSTLNELKSVIKKGFHVIVCYFDHEDGFGHYAVVKAVTPRYIYLLDPFEEPNFKQPLKQFIKDWYGVNTYRGWYFGVKK